MSGSPVDVLLVPDLPIERWPSMDRYALRLHAGLGEAAAGLSYDLASPVDRLTAEGGLPPDGPSSDWIRYLHRYYRYPRVVRRRSARLLHVLDHSYAHILRGRRQPGLVTVHDLLPLDTLARGERGFRARVRDRYLKRTVIALRSADGWIVATEWLRAALATWLGGDERIWVIPYGVDEALFQPPTRPRDVIRAEWNLAPEAFVVLHVGSAAPRKRLEIVLGAVAALRLQGIDAYLLQIGAALSPNQRSEIGRLGLDASVRTVGSVPERRLHEGYHAADALCFPSDYEGFGLPVLEAMAAGLPVVSSDAGGLGELARGAAEVLVDVSPETCALALGKIATDPAHRGELIRRGQTRAREFRWVETARKTLEVYRRFAA